MNRRDFLSQLQNFCLLYGLQGVLSRDSFAVQPLNRMVNFVIKYTGGTTDKDGLGAWNFDQVLSPLSPYRNEMAFPLGLNAQFHAPMNSHASPQISALSGAMTGFILRETHYPTGNLENFSNGSGKSIDVLIGEKLQSEYKSQIPYLLITNNDTTMLASTHKTSSWGAGGELLHAFSSVDSLKAEVASHIMCEKHSKSTYEMRLRALKHIKKNHSIFESKFLIDKAKFSQIEEKLIKGEERYQLNIKNIDTRGVVSCTEVSSGKEVSDSSYVESKFDEKMEHLYNLGLIALEQNISRVVTFNLYTAMTHATSHYSTENPLSHYLDASQFMQASVAKFLKKLKDANLYDDTLVFCNAGSCMSLDVHNYENLSTYVINGGKVGTIGSASVRRPVGDLHADLLKKFGIHFSEYGGTDHIYGVGKPGRYF